MKKILIKLLVCCLSVCCVASMFAACEEGVEMTFGWTYELNEDGTGYVVTKWKSGNGDDTVTKTITVNERVDIEIPAEHKGKPVVEIGYEAFRGLGHNIKSMTLPDSITKIGEHGLAGGFNTIKLPKNLEVIGEDGLVGCSLTSVDIPNSVKIIGKNALSISSLTTVTFGENSQLEEIGDSAFSGCKFESITLPQGLKSIGKGAFTGCNNLKSLVIPNSVTGAFGLAQCEALTSVTLSENITMCGISDCPALKSIVVPDSVTSLVEEAFAYCSNLESITLGSGLKSIDVYAFVECDKLTTAKFRNPNGWTVNGNPINGLDNENTAAEQLKSNMGKWIRTE